MPWKDCIPLLRGLGSFVVPVLFLVCFAHKGWVTTSTMQWGLWEWCYTNFSDTDDSNISRCHHIAPGDSPGYYEGVRTVSCFTLVITVLFFCSCNPKEGLGKGYKPSIIAALACLGAVTTLGILGGSYKEDRRWKDQDPSLSWCFWVLTVMAIFSFLLIFIIRKANQMHDESNAVSQQPNSNQLRRRDSNASTLSLHNGRKITIFRTSVADGDGGNSLLMSPEELSASSPRSPSSVIWRRGDDGDDAGRFPVLTLPLYDIPSEPRAGHPSVLPPAYEEVTRGVLTPPPPYTVTGSAEPKREH